MPSNVVIVHTLVETLRSKRSNSPSARVRSIRLDSYLLPFCVKVQAAEVTLPILSVIFVMNPELDALPLLAYSYWTVLLALSVTFVTSFDALYAKALVCSTVVSD